MRLIGILSESLGGFTCVRGFAPLGDLARSSEADLSYQRNLIEEQREAIVNFLKDKNYLFFPEVILSYNLKYDFAKGVSGIDPLTYIRDRKYFRSNIDKFTVRSQKSGVHKVVIDIPESWLKKHKPFFRIDGNHRLSAAPESADFNKYITPFCLVLFPDTPQSEEYKRVIFHNINSKSIPLTSEENLRLILDEEAIFSDEKLKNNASFGIQYYFARKLKDKVDLAVLAAISESFKVWKDNGDEVTIKRTVLLKLFELLKNKSIITENDVEINKVQAAINNVNVIYQAHGVLQDSNCFALFIAFVYYELNVNNGDYRKSFKTWVLSNHIYTIEEISATDLIVVYDTILTARSRNVFLSMQFDAQSDEVKQAAEEAIKEVNRRHKLDLKIKQIRIDDVNKGHAYTISDEILELINNTGLLIADLSTKNINVYHEVGFLMGLNRAKGFEQENFILLMRNRLGEAVDSNVGFNLRHWQQLRFDNGLKLKDNLIESLEIYYKLKMPTNEDSVK